MFFYSKKLTSSILKQKETEQALVVTNLNLNNIKIANEKIQLAELAEKEKSMRLEQERDHKIKELVSNTLLINQQYEVLNRIDEELKFIHTEAEGKVKTSSNKIRRIIKTNLSIDDNWKDFKIQFEQLHSDFFYRMKTRFPKLTENDLRHCAFIKMRMNTKEIARLLNINPTSVQISRVRMKKKMKLESETDLKEFIQDF
ncbi:hypothetical protein GCM10007940_14090 [Portibacter lacus]|uniref:HTH luxR-type domain-containing protein n=2 Tax=Portibacter lacus TaxID=1099794 RepID=A0AA37SPH7_9BACT|nr:hypothetical protein GCM10007940_14090 [Portibacter lacus]